MAKSTAKVFLVLKRTGTTIEFRDAGSKAKEPKIQVLDLVGFDYKKVQKNSQIQFVGNDVDAKNLTFLNKAGEWTQLSADTKLAGNRGRSTPAKESVKSKARGATPVGSILRGYK